MLNHLKTGVATVFVILIFPFILLAVEICPDEESNGRAVPDGIVWKDVFCAILILSFTGMLVYTVWSKM